MCKFFRSSNQINELQATEIDFIHYDIIDGNYAPDFTMGSSIINSIKKTTSIQSHYHLMVEEPMRIFQNFRLDKKDIFAIHQKTSKNLHKDLVEIKKHCKSLCNCSYSFRTFRLYTG